MGVRRSVTGLPLEIHRDESGDAVVGRVGFRVFAGPSPMEVRAVSVAVVDAFGAGARRKATGVSVPGSTRPEAFVRLQPGASVELSVWFDAVALGSAHDCRVVAELLVDGQRTLVASAAVVLDDGPSLAR